MLSSGRLSDFRRWQETDLALPVRCKDGNIQRLHPPASHQEIKIPTTFSAPTTVILEPTSPLPLAATLTARAGTRLARNRNQCDVDDRDKTDLAGASSC